MQPAPIPENEDERLSALRQYKILDTPCEEIFEDITHLAASICQTPISLISLIDKNRQFTKSNYGLTTKEVPRDISFCAHVILGSDIMEVKDATQDQRFLDNPFVTGVPEIRFYAGSPLTTPEGFRIGSLCVIDKEPKALTEEQKKMLSTLSKVVMTLLELKRTVSVDLTARAQATERIQNANDKLEEKLNEQKQNNNTLTLFSKMNGMLQSCVTYEEAYSIIKSFCQKIFSESAGTLYLLSASREQLEHVLSWKDPSSEIGYFLPEDCWALRRGQYYVTDNPMVDVTCPHFKKNSLKGATHICLPLNAQSETIGLLCLENISAINASETQLLYAVRMAEQIALCLANIKLRQTLRHQSTCDPLTGLYNRRYLASAFKREIVYANLNKTKLAAMLIDIDHFKKFNDTHGHDAGDLVLTTLAELLKNHVDEREVVCRLGGEEFLLVLHETKISDISMRAEKIRQAVEQIQLKYKENDLGILTISAGIAFFPTHAKDLDQLLIAADNALYQAKENGRNQIIFSDGKNSRC